MLSPFHHRPCPDNPIKSTVLNWLQLRASAQAGALQRMGNVRTGSWCRSPIVWCEGCGIRISTPSLNTTIDLSGLWSKVRGIKHPLDNIYSFDCFNPEKGKKSRSTRGKAMMISKNCVRSKRYILQKASKVSQLSILYQNPFSHI